jgi:hypothetical protein
MIDFAFQLIAKYSLGRLQAVGQGGTYRYQCSAASNFLYSHPTRIIINHVFNYDNVVEVIK